jgi:hypothetical protein
MARIWTRVSQSAKYVPILTHKASLVPKVVMKLRLAAILCLVINEQCMEKPFEFLCLEALDKDTSAFLSTDDCLSMSV